MVSLMPSASWSGSLSGTPPSPSHSALGNAAGPSRSPTPSMSSTGSVGGRSISSRNSSQGLQTADEENQTITVSARLPAQRRHSGEEDLRLLSVSANITELSYTISDIQTRIFEIQELRHETHGDSSGASTIDVALTGLDERLAAVRVGVRAVDEAIKPILASAPAPTQANRADGDDVGALSRKHTALLDEWAAVQREAELLRDELREDKWLTVFRTVTEQADGMMGSLEKAIHRCQDFLRQMRANEPIAPALWPPDPERPAGEAPSTADVFIALAETFDAKKRHYIPATNKVLAILDKGVQDRVTKNGECLRRHAESTQRWKNLQARLSRTDDDMDAGKLFLLAGESTPSEAGSSASGSTAVSGVSNGFLATPPVGGRGSGKKAGGRVSGTLSLSRSISPLRNLARKLKGVAAEPVTPEPTRSRLLPASEPAGTLRRQRTSIFSFKSSQRDPPVTPERAGHRPTQSFAQAAHSVSRRSDASTNGGLGAMKHAPAWNPSTKVEDDRAREREKTATLRPSPQRRPSAMGFYASVSALASPSAGSSKAGSSGVNTPYKRSLSRSSMGSSRPWSPLTSSMSSNASSSALPIPPIPGARPPSRSYIPAPPQTPRSRPKTPSLIPTPRSAPARVPNARSPAMGSDRARERAVSPSPGAGNESYFPDMPDTPTHAPPPRPPSRSMIPIPSVHLYSASRPGSAMSQYRPDTSMSVRPRAPATPRLPPSAFRDSPRTPAPGGSGHGSTSRPSSRAGSRLGGPVGSADGSRGPVHVYHPVAGGKDPLDVAVAALANGMAHACIIERVDAPLRAAPSANTEVRATYAFSTPIGRKQLPLKLAAPGRDGTRKVLYRGGGGWTELREYLLAHPT